MRNYLTVETFANISKIIPVVVIDEISNAVPLARALLAGGINVMEVTLRTNIAFSVIEQISNHVPEMIVGAGSVVADDQYHHAVKMGAKFIISPGLTNDLAHTSRYYDVPFIPGALTPSEVMKAFVRGFSYLKFFPAEASGGFEVIKAMQGPFSNVKFCPTGGINLTNLQKYLSLANVFAAGCSFIVDKTLINAKDFIKITELSKQAINLANGIK